MRGNAPVSAWKFLNRVILETLHIIMNVKWYDKVNNNSFFPGTSRPYRANGHENVSKCTSLGLFTAGRWLFPGTSRPYRANGHENVSKCTSLGLFTAGRWLFPGTSRPYRANGHENVSKCTSLGLFTAGRWLFPGKSRPYRANGHENVSKCTSLGLFTAGRWLFPGTSRPYGANGHENVSKCTSLGLFTAGRWLLVNKCCDGKNNEAKCYLPASSSNNIQTKYKSLQYRMVLKILIEMTLFYLQTRGLRTRVSVNWIR